MREWIEPKTDWRPTDYINNVDHNRITNNLTFLKELAETMYLGFSWEDMGRDKVYSDIVSPDDWNTIEDNLENLLNGTFPAASGKMVTFYDNGAMIDYMELNRIEEAILRFYKCLTSQYESLRVLAFTLGGDDFG